MVKGGWRMILVSIVALSLSSVGICIEEGSNDCGLGCCYTVFQLYSPRPIEAYSVFRKSQPPVSEKGLSMLDLCKLCEGRGLYCSAIEVSDLNVLKLLHSYSVIAHTQSSHFVVVKGIGTREVECVDPPYLRHYSIERFSSEWDGKVILVSDKPIRIDSPWDKRIFEFLGIVCIFIAGVFAFKFFKKRLA
jgi:ABC-type bacteriocin/lantibiotic exporter with double-glycine peptidase domain